MAFTSEDYRLTTFMVDTDGNNYNNVYAFKARLTTSTAVDLANAWVEDVWPPLVDILSNSVSLTRIVVENLNDPTDFHDNTLTGFIGGQTGERMPSFVGYAFRINRQDQRTRHGRKTFGPIPESASINGIINPTFVPYVNAVASVLTLGIDYDAGSINSIYDICIPKTVKVEPLGKDPYYVWDELILAASVSFVRISSQVSRNKYVG